MEMDILADMEKEKIYDSEEARDEMEIAETRHKKRIRFVGVGMVVLVVLNLLVGGVGALEDTFQNYPSNLASDSWEKVWDSGAWYAWSITTASYSDTYIFEIGDHLSGSGGGTLGVHVKQKEGYGACSNYWSFVIRGTNIHPSASPSFVVYFYNSTNGSISNSNNLASHISASDHCELLRAGNTIALYVNGEYKTDIGGTYNEMPCYIGFKVICLNAWHPNLYYLDDIVTDPDIGTIGIFPHNWTIKRNWDNPTVNGLYDNTDTKQYTHKFHTSYAWHNVTSLTGRNTLADSIITKYFYTGEVVNTTSLSIESENIIEYNLTEMLFHDDTTDDKYGLYYQELKRSGETLAQDYFWFDYDSASKPSGGTISFDKDSYVSGETAEVTHHLDSPDFGNYYYKGYIYDMSTAEQKATWSISSADGTENLDLADYDAGNYYAILRIDDKSSTFEYDMAFDTCAVNEEILIEGITYNAETEAILGTVSASFLQGVQYYNATSNTSTGEYNVSGLSVDIETDVNATKTNYTHNDFSFTPLQVDIYEMDIFMLPNISYISYHNTSIGGLVQSSLFYQNVSGATVNIWNLSWSDNIIANTMGYYIFENLTNGTYSINATSAGYLASSNEEVETNNGSFLYHYILLEPQFILTIKARDIGTHATITDFTAIVNDDDVQDTTNGSIGFTVGCGIHKVEASAEGYYASLEYVYVDEDTEKIMYLTPLETGAEGGAGVYYPPPHLVRFFLQDIYANPKQDVLVTTTCIQTTMGSWDWLYNIFGFKNETQLEETVMNGTTDSYGSISFLMVETIKYSIHFENATQGIDETLTIYPKSDRYTVIVGRTGFFDVEPQLFGEQINWNFTMEKINTTAAWLNFTYNDTLSQTISGSYYVFMVNETTGVEKINMSNRTYYCSTPESFNSSGGVWYYNCIVHEYRGNTYILGFNATHTTAGEFEEAVSIFFRYNHPLIQFAGWENTGYYQFLSICILVFFSLLFTGVTIKVGAALLPLIGWILFGIGWFSPTDNLVTGAILLGIATAIGISVFITTTGREKNLAS